MWNVLEVDMCMEMQGAFFLRPNAVLALTKELIMLIIRSCSAILFDGTSGLLPKRHF